MTKLLGALAAGFLSAAAMAVPNRAVPQPISIGTSHQIESRPMAETRTVNVALPASYASEPARR